MRSNRILKNILGKNAEGSRKNCKLLEQCTDGVRINMINKDLIEEGAENGELGRNKIPFR